MYSSCDVIYFFFFNDTATTEIYTYCHTLSLHDALPISDPVSARQSPAFCCARRCHWSDGLRNTGSPASGSAAAAGQAVDPRRAAGRSRRRHGPPRSLGPDQAPYRSAEHPAELQALMLSSSAVFCVKEQNNTHNTI